ncbi:hypothetical protein JIQ42_03365 [Leishmania sp. Namibia]|uniref:hypothetical protein n=1 Tax=Leishmania sp. Namibia TaxID=2802991 RepID=UPI001B61217A|nr:hypothetical protein JIQ42_03365 [Leishmania sp. Namibia]
MNGWHTSAVLHSRAPACTLPSIFYACTLFFSSEHAPYHLHETMSRRVGTHVSCVICSRYLIDRKCSTQDSTAAPSFAELKGRYEVLRAQVLACKGEIQKLRSENLYTAASCENIRKTAQEQAKQAHNDAIRSFARDMLDVCDALQVVTKKVEEYTQGNSIISKSEASVLTGVTLTEEVALRVLKRYGVTRMHTKVGALFDEEKEEKLFTVPSTPSLQEGSVAEIVKSGYDMNGLVLRRAEVGLSEDS